VIVHLNGPLGPDAGGLGQLDAGPDPCGHDDEVAGHMLPGGEDHLGDVPFAVHHGVRRPDAQQEPAPVVLEHLLVHGGGIAVGLEGHDPGGHLRDGHLGPPAAEGGGGVQAHEAAPHDKDPLAPGKGGVDLQRVAEVPEAEDVGGLPEVGDGRDEESGARGDEELVVGHTVPLAVGDGLGRRINAGHGLTGDVVDVVFLEKVRRDEVDALRRALMPQELVEHTAGVDLLVR